MNVRPDLMLDQYDGRSTADGEVRPAGDALLTEVVVARAADLARTGRYAEAESILVHLLGDPPRSAAALDLLARIHAQQGRWREAEALWQAAAALDPSNPAYAAGLRRLQRTAGQKAGRALSRPLLTGAAALVIVAIAVIVARQMGDSGSAPPPATEDRIARVAALRADVERLIAGEDANDQGVDAVRRRETLASIRSRLDQLLKDIEAQK